MLLTLATGLILQYSEIIDWFAILNSIRQYSDSNLVIVSLVVLLIILFMFALPGSGMLWIIAPLYQPVFSTLLLTLGTTLGALAAYWLAGKVKSPWLDHIKSHAVFERLHRHGDFHTLFALRIFPGFPHSVINYGCGLLRISIRPFLIATCIGVSIKSYLYSRVIFTSTSADNFSEALTLHTIWPLLILLLISLLPKLLKLWKNKIKKA